jgi:hypothetical protein
VFEEVQKVLHGKHERFRLDRRIQNRISSEVLARNGDDERQCLKSDHSHVKSCKGRYVQITPGLSKIEEDFEQLKETLVQYIRHAITGHKTQIIKRFSDLNNSNSRSLGSISQKINLMVGFSEDIHKELQNTLMANIDDTSKLERIITSSFE